MIDITTRMNKFLQTLNKNFEERVWFVGLQGSYISHQKDLLVYPLMITEISDVKVEGYKV